MSWNKQFKMSKLSSLQKALEDVVQIEVNRVKENAERLIKVLEIKNKHELGTKTSTSTTD